MITPPLQSSRIGLINMILTFKDCWKKNTIFTEPSAMSHSKRVHTITLKERYRRYCVKCRTHCWARRLMRSSCLLIARTWKKIHSAPNTAYGPTTPGSIPLLNADGKTLITDKEKALKCLPEYFHAFMMFSIHHLSSVMKQLPVCLRFQQRNSLAEHPSLCSWLCTWCKQTVQNVGELGFVLHSLQRLWPYNKHVEGWGHVPTFSGCTLY